MARVLLPADYTAAHVALAYAVTVHKAEGVTVDRAVLLADAATSAEHLYVGMTRGRYENRTCVVTDAASTGHGHRSPPAPVEILAQVMRRSSAELSASETLRNELDRGEDLTTLRRLREQARHHIDTSAGPDRRPELRRLRRLRFDLPTLANIVAANQTQLARIDSVIATTRNNLAHHEDHLEALTRPRRFRRPDHDAINEAAHRIHAQQRYLRRLDQERADRVTQLDRSRRRLQDAERAIARIPDVEAAITRRSHWLLSHPAELAWEVDLATRLAHRTGEVQATPSEHERANPEHDLEPTHLDIDLRTIDLSPHRPRTGIERHLREALGLSRPRDAVDIPLPPLPGHGIDGPDLGR